MLKNRDDVADPERLTTTIAQSKMEQVECEEKLDKETELVVSIGKPGNINVGEFGDNSLFPIDEHP